MSIAKTERTNVVRGFGKHREFRTAVVYELNKQSIVINKVEVSKDKDTGVVTTRVYKGLIGDSPIAREFGLSDIVMRNVLVDEKDDNGNSTQRRVNIDPDGRYVFSENLILVTCDDLALINEYQLNGFTCEELKGERYLSIGASPSNEKHSCKYYVRVNDEIADEMAAFSVLERINGYVFSRGLFNKIRSGKKISKGNTRLGNYFSGMKLFSSVDLTKDYIAVVDTEINNVKYDSIVGAYDFTEEVREQMEAAGICIDNHINDGASYCHPAVIVKAAKSVGVKMSQKQALREAPQVRTTTLTGKTMYRVLEEEDMLRIAKFNNAKFYGNTSGRLMLLTDADGAKLINYEDLSDEGIKANHTTINLYFMAIANASGARTSTQSLIKYMSIDPQRTLAILEKLFAEHLDNFIGGKVFEGNDFTTVRATILSMLGEEALETTAFVEKLIQDILTFAEAAIAKNKIDIAGIYSHMMFDLSYAITCGKIANTLGVTKDGFVEAFSQDICRAYAEEIAEIEAKAIAGEITEEECDELLFDLLSGVVVKYPSATPKEFEVIVYLTKRQLERRISNMELNNDEADILRNYWSNTPWGVTVYAPINSLKNKLAGADVDFDATMTDMSEFKWVAIDNRRKELASKPGYAGQCVYISYANIDRTNMTKDVQATVVDPDDDVDFE
jgi:hypothetical protein